MEEAPFADFSQILCRWYTAHKRDLPWRGEPNPYYVWLSEIILQQTRVSQGLPYYLNFVEQFPTVADLANAPEEQVLKVWQGLGYYSRARNLQQAAQYIMRELGGVFPTTYEGLLALKGVGDYTASAVASICYNEAKAVVDGNVYRVLSRIFDIETPINTTEGVKYFRELAYHRGKVEQLPVKLPKVKIRQRYFHYCVLSDTRGYTQVQRRGEGDIWHGLYEFPLVETQTALSQEQVWALLKEKYPQAATIAYPKQTYMHKLTHQHLHVSFWHITLAENLTEGIPFVDLKQYPMPVVIQKYIDNC